MVRRIVSRMVEQLFIVQLTTNEGQPITVAFVRGGHAAREREADVRRRMLAGEPIAVEGQGFSVAGEHVKEVRIHPVDG